MQLSHDHDHDGPAILISSQAYVYIHWLIYGHWLHKSNYHTIRPRWPLTNNWMVILLYYLDRKLSQVFVSEDAIINVLSSLWWQAWDTYVLLVNGQHQYEVTKKVHFIICQCDTETDVTDCNIRVNTKLWKYI
jgi:hypothetical protein